MLELEIMILQRGNNAKVLPLFYELHPHEVKNPKNLSELWRPAWKKIKDGMYVEQWEKALKALCSFNGLVFKKGSSETSYIQEVVHKICDLVGYSVPYDLSLIQGHERIAKEIASRFEDVKANHGVESTCMVGVHGIGGLGKTTLCKSMVNFYTTPYHGRCSLIEFPSDGDKSKIVQECKRVLEKLMSFQNERVLDEANDFDQVVHLMAQHVKRYDMFLAIDNVWDSCRVEAERLLGVGFSGSSKILLTSRSEQVLHEVLIDHTNTSCVLPLPTPKHEEAFQIFQRTFKLSDLKSLVTRNQIDRVLERCKFSGSFHALALEAFGKRLKQVCLTDQDPKKVKAHLSLVLEDMSHPGKEGFEDVINLNYDILPEHKKRMFIDVAFSFRQDTLTDAFFEDKDSLTIAEACQWLGWLYKDQFARSKISSLIYELASGGLIQIGPEDEDGERRIGVHDLYKDLAQSEATNGSRFFMDWSTRSVEEMQWERLERAFARWYAGTPREAPNSSRSFMVDGSIRSSVEEMDQWHRLERAFVLCNAAGTRFFEKLEQEECRSLQMLSAYGTHIINSGLCLNFVPSLRVLTLVKVTFGRGESRSAASGVLDVGGLVQLRALWLDRCESVRTITGLDALQNLQSLAIWSCSRLKKFDGSRWSGRSLQYISIVCCESLKKMADLSGLAGLQSLELLGNEKMEEVGGEYLSPTLTRLSLKGSPRLRRFPSWKDCVNLCESEIDGEYWQSSTHDRLKEHERWERPCLHIAVCHGGIVGRLEVGFLSSLTNLCVGWCDAVSDRALHCLQMLEIIRERPRLKVKGGGRSRRHRFKQVPNRMSLTSSTRA